MVVVQGRRSEVRSHQAERGGVVDLPQDRSGSEAGVGLDRATWDGLLVAYDRMRIASSNVSRHGAALSGIALVDLRALVVVRRQPGISPSALAVLLELTRAGMTSMVDRLVAAGALVRSADPDDRRGQRLEVTPAGVEALEVVRSDFVEAFSEVFAAEGLDVDDVELMAERFARLANAFERVGAARQDGATGT